MPPAPALGRTRVALAGCVVLLGLTAVLVGTVVPAWAYPLINTVVAAVLIVIAVRAGVAPEAIGLTLGRRTVFAALTGLACVAAVLATGWLLPPVREVFTASPAASISSAGLLRAVLVRVPFGTVLLEEVAPMAAAWPCGRHVVRCRRGHKPTLELRDRMGIPHRRSLWTSVNDTSTTPLLAVGVSMRKTFTTLATVFALAFSLLALAGPAAAQGPVATTAATSATDDIEIQVRRMWFPYLSQCAAVGAAGVVLGSWDRWFCSPQFPAGWRLYTNR